jgi:hypothetical protein
MSTQVLTNCRLHLGGYELSGISNSIGIDYGAEMKDDTVFGTAGTRSNKPGLKTVKINGHGFWDADYDEALYNRIGAAREVASLTPEGQTVGDRAFFTRGVNGAYNPLTGEIGELVGFDIDLAAANTLLVRGQVGALGTKTVTGTGSGIQLGAVLAAQKIYAALHVKNTIAGTTPTLNVIVESDDNSGFTTPTTRLTFTQVTTVIGAQWQELAGAITDDWWRVKWTLGGTTPSYPLFVSFGIL